MDEQRKGPIEKMAAKDKRDSQRIHLRSKAALVIFSAVLLAAAGLRIVTAQNSGTLRGDAILDHLNAVIDWYRHAMTRVQTVGLPSDAMYQFNAQTMAGEVAKLAFQSAQSEAALIPAASPPSGGNASSSQQNLDKLRSDVNARISALEAQISTLNQQISGARKAQLQNLTAQKQRAQGELDLNKAMQQTFEQMSQFMNTNGTSGTGGLEGSINELQHSVPELTAGSKTEVKPPSTVAMPASTGLIGEVVQLYEQLNSMHQISLMMAETAHVKDVASKLRSPLQATLRATIQQGQQLASQNSNAPPAAQAQPAQPNQGQPDQERRQFDVLTTRFKQIAAAAVPLREETILLDQSNANYLEWRQSVAHESNRILRNIVLRVLGIALAIGVILLLSEIWRRITFRYIQDVRRRRQFLLLRRIVIGFCMGIVLILGFVSEFSSLATFAGFITAGLAVGLQTILLSVAAYFFLVGRWGIRVGDRISVAGVTGDVVDVGLVRLYLMELAGTGVDLYPTGRIVVFSNSVLFQATTPLFKQLPGAEYTWHEVAVGLNPGGKYELVEKQLLDAVRSVHTTYGEELQRQLGATERRIDIQMTVPEPHGQLQYTDTGLEYVVRYPVGLHQVAEADEKITRKLLEFLQQQPDLQASVSGFPKIRAAVKG
jgi:small-conductance mechanosensitive channel